jgi:hypothetical protein
MISLAGRDILHSWGKFVLTGLGLGLLIGVTLTMAGVYRGMVDDAKVLLNNSGADLWVVQKDTLGPYAEPSSIHDDVYREILGMPGVAQASNVTYLTMQVRKGNTDMRAMVVGLRARQPRRAGYLVAGRRVTRSHYEAVADVKAALSLATVLASAVMITLWSVSAGAWCPPAATRWCSFRSKTPRRLSFSRTTMPSSMSALALPPIPPSTAQGYQACWIQSTPCKPATTTSMLYWSG